MLVVGAVEELLVSQQTTERMPEEESTLAPGTVAAFVVAIVRGFVREPVEERP